MMYEINEATGGICTLSEMMRHDCTTCPKKGMCDYVVELYEEKKRNELSLSKKNELSDNGRER